MATMIKVADLMTTEERRLQGAQICQKLLRAGLLEHLLSFELLWMLCQDACGGGPHDERHQTRNGSGDRRLESESALETGKNIGEDRAHCYFPCYQTDRDNITCICLRPWQ
eukprot:9844503-Heterocapsa_arctica.AAC.2